MNLLGKLVRGALVVGGVLADTAGAGAWGVRSEAALVCGEHLRRQGNNVLSLHWAPALAGGNMDTLGLTFDPVRKQVSVDPNKFVAAGMGDEKWLRWQAGGTIWDSRGVPVFPAQGIGGVAVTDFFSQLKNGSFVGWTADNVQLIRYTVPLSQGEGIYFDPPANGVYPVGTGALVQNTSGVQERVALHLGQLDDSTWKQTAIANGSYLRPKLSGNGFENHLGQTLYVAPDPSTGSGRITTVPTAPAVPLSSLAQLTMKNLVPPSGVTTLIPDRLLFIDRRSDGSTPTITLSSSAGFFWKGLMYVDGNLDISGASGSPTIRAQNPDQYQADPGGGALATSLSACILDGILFCRGEMRRTGNVTMYGSLMLAQTNGSLGLPDVYYNSRLKYPILRGAPGAPLQPTPGFIVNSTADGPGDPEAGVITLPGALERATPGVVIGFDPVALGSWVHLSYSSPLPVPLGVSITGAAIPELSLSSLELLGGNRIERLIFSGAGTAVTIRSQQCSVRNCRFEHNSVGVLIEGEGPSYGGSWNEVSANRFYDNTYAVVVEGTNNLIGGELPSEGNEITGNRYAFIIQGVRNRLLANRLTNNNEDIWPTSYNPPVFFDAVLSGDAGTTVVGHTFGLPSFSPCRLEFFAREERHFNDEPSTFSSAVDLTATANGDLEFAHSFGEVLQPGNWLMVTRTTPWDGTTTSFAYVEVRRDTTPPVLESVTDAGAWQTRTDRISASWPAASDPESFIERFDVAVGTSAGAADVVPFHSVGRIWSADVPAPLSHGGTYYVTVRAVNYQGLVTERSTDGITVDAVAPVPHLSTEAPPATSSSVVVRVVFDEAVSGFAADDLVITNATMSSFTDEDTSASWSFILNPSAEGAVSVEIPVGRLEDAAGNANPASGLLSRQYDVTPPEGRARAADPTQAGTTISVGLETSDAGPAGVASVTLLVRGPGQNEFLPVLPTTEALGGELEVEALAGSGVYEFAAIATDGAGNREAGELRAETSVTVNIVPNGALTRAVEGADGALIFPMTDDLDVTVTLTGASPGGHLTVSRNASVTTAPAEFRYPGLLLSESLQIEGENLGPFQATLEWAFDPSSAGNLGGASIDRVYSYDGELREGEFPVTPEGGVLRVEGVTGFSTWYAGSSTAVPVTLTGFGIE